MENYYDEILQTIKELIEKKEFDEAKALIHTELKMPYVPVEFESEVKELLKDIKEMSGSETISVLSDEEIEECLFRNDEFQLYAVNQLNAKNLRQMTDLIERYFKSKPNPYAAALLIDSCIEQRIDDTFTYIKGDMEYQFSPIMCLRPFESDGFNEAQSYLEDWFESDDPSFYKFVMQQLIHECFDYLPLSYDYEDGYQLAIQVVRQVLVLVDRENEWDQLALKLTERQDLLRNRQLS
ncbi:DUF3196 family protein [Anaerorhabdus sp.]|uniref:DUF3196 family protein n=1 Tax=Anaerorhabdus sp. TaxID=1872524 RepID=UPI002FC5ED29